ncbi:polycystin-1-like protein 2 [Glandiceps talaboti]
MDCLQLKAADGMLSLSSTLKSLPNETMSGTLNSATEILSCGSNVLSVSMYDVKPVAKPKRKVSLGDEKSKNSAVTKTIAATLNAASDAVLNKTSNDGEPVSIASDAFDLQLQKSNPADMPSTLGGNGAGSFQLPKGELFGDSTDPVSTQLTSFKGNPLKWAGGSSTITGDVMSLSLKKDDGNELEVSGLNDGVVIVIPNTETDLPDPYFVSVVEENGTEIFSWDLIVADVNTSIRIDIVSLLDDGDQNYTFTIYNVSISHENLTLNITLEPVPISNFTFFVPDEDVTIPGVYVVSINEVGPDFVNFTVEMSTFTCRYMDEENDEWTSKGCKVLPVSDMTAVHCRCTHLSTFGSGFKMIPPNPIDFSTVFAKFKDLDENASVFSTVITMFGLYLVVVIWARHADKKDENEGLMPLVDNNEYDEYLYKVMVHTDVRREAQTKSNVFINVIGDKHRAENRQLKYADMKSFRRGGVVKFVMAVPESLGTIQGIKIWHDNSGKDKSASWCLAKILIEDIQSNKNYFFTCNRWLAVDKDDNKIERFLKASPNEKIGSAKGAFVSKANQDLLDGHIWFSVVGRPASSHFTRVQRASCCLSLIFTSMIANAMWYKTEETNEDDFVIRIGPISISWHQMYVGIMSSMVVFPVNLIIVQLFRKSRPTNVKFDFKRKKKKKKKKVKKNKVKRKLIQNKKSDGIDTLSHMSTIIAGTEPEWDPVGGALHTNKLAEDNANYLRLAGTIKTISSKENQFNFDKALGPSMWSKDDLSLKKKGNGMTIREPPTLAINGNHMEPPSGQDTSAADLRALLESPDSAVSDTSDKKEEKEKKPKEEFWLPHWCLYIAWVLVFLSSVGSAFFTILYSLEWGHEKATEWLISLLVSFLQDVILMQPIKVIILAVVITIIMKQIRKRKGEVDDDDQYLRDTENEDGFNVNNKDLLKAKELREREDTMWSFFREIAVYMFFVIIILSIAYGQRDLTASYMHKSVKDIFVMNSQYSSLSSGFGDFYIWVNEILLPGLYPTEAYNGDDLGNINKDLKMFIDDGYFAYRIGSPRFRQLRVPTDSCSPPPETAFLFSECNGDYNLLTQDETNYGEGWSDDYDPNKTSIGFRDDVWIYHNMTDLEGVPLYGVETLYSGGGYVAVLDTFLWRAKWKVDYLQDTRWLDDRTRAVFVEFTLYNAHVNLFSMFTLLLEYPSTGGALVKTKIDVLRIYNYVGSMTVFVAICEVLFIIMLIYYLIKALIDIKNQKKKYFKQFWNWIEVSKIGLCMAGISMRGYKALFFDIALEELSAEDGE